MQKNLDCSPVFPPKEGSLRDGYVLSAENALAMRKSLRFFLEGILSNILAVRLPSMPRELVLRSEGHFHLVPELFLQVSGSTRFMLPHEELELNPGEALIMPPRVLHAELALENTPGEMFRNVVVFVNGTALTCHLAHDGGSSKRPGILHLEARHHTHAPRIHDWLADAANLGWEAQKQQTPEMKKLLSAQMRALVASACAGVLRVLDDSAPNTKPEPVMITRVRMWVQNRLGDHDLSVPKLAMQAGCTPDYLSHIFSHTTGENLVTYINRERMQRAASLLAETKMVGKEVAWVCGFSTPSYFIQMFRTHYGTTPKNWRAKRKNDSGNNQPED